MKKLFMFLAVAGLATFGASCSSDDGGTPPPPGGKDQLVAKASPSTVEVNKDVTFSATADGKAVDGVSFYLGETKLTNPHKFAAKGEYKVVAKKDGYKDSAAITVKVTEEPVTEPQLKLSASTTSIKVDESVVFIVRDENNATVNDAKIFLGSVELTGSSYTAVAADAGKTLKFTAKKGDVVSNEISVQVKELPNQEVDYYIMYEGIKYEVTDAHFIHAGSQPFGDGIIDLYDMEIYMLDDADQVVNLVYTAVAFPRTNVDVAVLPTDGQIGVAAWGGTAIVLDGEPVEVVVTNNTVIELTGFANLVDVEAGVKGAENGKIVFDYGLTGSEERVTGLYQGPVIIVTADAARQARSAATKTIKVGASSSKLMQKKR